MSKNICLITLVILGCFASNYVLAQSLQLPDPNATNLKCSIGRKVGVTDIKITYNSPAVRGREGSIWGTNVVPYGFTVLGFGSNVESPWRAGADECTTIEFSTDVSIQGQVLPAGKYAFFIAVYPDSCVLIFNKNIQEWGSYFYDRGLDVLRVKTVQEKNSSSTTERLEYRFEHQTNHGVIINLNWEKWSIPIPIEVDYLATTLASIKSQMSGGIGFDPPSLQAAADWCLSNNVNLDQATIWITSATDPNLGGVTNFGALKTKSGLLKLAGKTAEADLTMNQAIDNATSIELHGYGRQLLGEKKISEALAIFEKNYKKNEGRWPTSVGMMRGLSAKGNYPEALKYAKIALTQAPDDVNKKNLEASIKTLASGKGI
ncbi:MAG: DUF2911 domain-containing protein [Saprospiraceae bacterium]|nr:DUF2911 domain-containing protein [Saprospiraceae bacterium]